MSRFVSRIKVLFIALSIVFLAVVLAVIWFQFKSRGNSKVGDNEVVLNYNTCLSDEIGIQLKNDFPYFTASSVESMGEITTDIEALSNLDKAINCQYVLARYDAYRGDLSGSADHFQKVIEIHESDNVWVDVAVGIDVPDDVRKITASYRETAKMLTDQNEKNRIKLNTE